MLFIGSSPEEVGQYVMMDINGEGHGRR